MRNKNLLALYDALLVCSNFAATYVVLSPLCELTAMTKPNSTRTLLG